jgi:hypothetical protein
VTGQVGRHRSRANAFCTKTPSVGYEAVGETYFSYHCCFMIGCANPAKVNDGIELHFAVSVVRHRIEQRERLTNLGYRLASMVED